MLAARAGHLLGCLGRGRHNQDFGAREHAGKAHLDVACPRRHVDDEVVDIAPGDLFQEMLDGPVEQQGSPHDGLVLAGEETHRHDPQLTLAEVTDQRLDQFAPWFVRVMPGLELAGSRPSIRGTEKPAMSASSTPTVKPLMARPAARLTDIDDLPTPPLPEDTATTLALGGHCGPRRGLARLPASPCHHGRLLLPVHLARLDLDRSDAGRAPTLPVTSALIWPLRGHEGVVSATRTTTTPFGCSSTSSTILSSTILSPSSGSTTARSASRTCCLGELGERFHHNIVRPFGTPIASSCPKASDPVPWCASQSAQEGS